MDPYAPINGISLERYAELGAELDGITSDAEQRKKVQELGVSGEDWDAAKAGWTARMQDMSLMGQVATRYMQLFNEAVAKKKGTVSVSFEDFCAMSAAIAVFGVEAMLNHYQISQGDWTSISGHWLNEMSRDPMNLGMRRNQLQEQETARLRAGGQPKPVEFQRGAAGSPPAGGGTAFDPAAQGAMQMQAAQQQQQAAMQYANQVMGSPMGQMATGMAGAMDRLAGGSGMVPGSQVLVQWSDGNKYPATLMGSNGDQSQISLADGRLLWCKTEYLSKS
jgi:hypothetical protein